MKNTKLVISIVILFPFLCHANPSEIVYKWQSLERKLILSQNLMSKTSDSKNLAVSFIIEYYPNMDCRATASILSIAKTTPHSDKTAPTLGKFKSKDMIKSNKKGNQLSFLVNGKEIYYRKEKIMRVIYENGVEFGVIAPSELITELDKSNGNLEVFLGELDLIKITKSEGFSEGNKKTYNYCLSNKK